MKDIPKYLKILFRIIATISLLTIVFYKTDFSNLEVVLLETKWFYVFLSWVVAIVAFLIRSLKMKLILKILDCNSSILTLTAISSVATLYSLILPGPLSSGVKWYILKKDTGKGTNVFSAMVYNQLSDIVIMAIFGFAGLSFISLSNNPKIFILSIAGMLLLFISIFLFFEPRLTSKISIVAEKFNGVMPLKIAEKIKSVFLQISLFQKIGLRFHFNVIGITILASFISIIVYFAACKAVDITVPIGLLAWQCILIYLLGCLPISFANLGVREFTLIEMFSRYNISSSQALMMSVVLFSNVILMAIIGALCQFYWFAKALINENR